MKGAHVQLDFGFPRPLPPEKVAQSREEKPRPLSHRRFRWPTLAPRVWEDTELAEALTWQEAMAREVGIPRSGPI